VGFGIIIGFTEPLDLVAIFNYSVIFNSYTFQFSKARTMPSVCCVFGSRSWVTALTDVDSTPSGFNGFCARWLETLIASLTAPSKSSPSELLKAPIRFSVHSLGTDSTENITSKSSSVFSCEYPLPKWACFGELVKRFGWLVS
jgi:hypothetical protein